MNNVPDTSNGIALVRVILAQQRTKEQRFDQPLAVV
ncbi:MAG: hypothetical protein ACJAWL_002447 [Motiliproteus sp.]|jgi:hypothetical protein